MAILLDRCADQAAPHLFDYGDHHLFEIKVVDIQAQALPTATYPRVTGGRGDAPPQYQYYGE